MRIYLVFVIAFSKHLTDPDNNLLLKWVVLSRPLPPSTFRIYELFEVSKLLLLLKNWFTWTVVPKVRKSNYFVVGEGLFFLDWCFLKEGRFVSWRFIIVSGAQEKCCARTVLYFVQFVYREGAFVSLIGVSLQSSFWVGSLSFSLAHLKVLIKGG